MAKKKYKNDRDIPLFPDLEEAIQREKKNRKHQKEKAEQEKKWHEMEEEFLTWLFSGTQIQKQSENNTNATVGKIAHIITIDI